MNGDANNKPDISVYRVMAVQSSTDPPTIDYILENTTGITPTWQYVDVGKYNVVWNDGGDLEDEPTPWSSDNAWTTMGADTNWIPVYHSGTLAGYYTVSYEPVTGLTLKTYDTTFQLANDIINDYVSVELKIYERAIAT